MNSVHDIGGMDGFGPIHRETGEPVFHEPWESRVFGMSMLGAGLAPIPLDARRHQSERLNPVQYISSTYYERWLARIDAALVDAGTLTRDEIDKRMQVFAAQPDLPIPRREDPSRAGGIGSILRTGRSAARKIRQKPSFAAGDKVVTRNLNPHGHTRLPRYARGKHGVIVAHHGAHVFPDSNAHGLGENPQHLYTVRIAMRELWGDSAEANESVLIDLWESYLHRDRAAAASRAPKNPGARKKVVAKTLPRAAKVNAPAASARRSLAGQPPSAAPNPAGAAGKVKRGNASAARGSGRSGRDLGKTIRRSR